MATKSDDTLKLAQATKRETDALHKSVNALEKRVKELEKRVESAWTYLKFIDKNFIDGIKATEKQVGKNTTDIGRIGNSLSGTDQWIKRIEKNVLSMIGENKKRMDEMYKKLGIVETNSKDEITNTVNWVKEIAKIQADHDGKQERHYQRLHKKQEFQIKELRKWVEKTFDKKGFFN